MPGINERNIALAEFPQVEVQKITFSEDRVKLNVRVCGEISHDARHHLNELLINEVPDVMEHACVNSHGPKFGDCAGTTSIAHILEHIIIHEFSMMSDIVSEANLSKPGERCLTSLRKKKLFVGSTTNIGPDLAKIELNYYDDIQALRAISAATDKLNELLKKACEESEH